MNEIDLKLKIDVESIMRKGQARKVLSIIISKDLGLVTFTGHGREQCQSRNLSINDVVNALFAGKIFADPEWEKECWRYRVETRKITAIISFKRPNRVFLVTAWRNR